MQAERLSQKDVAELMELSILTVGRFLRHQSHPQRETLEKIEGFLKNEGAMTRFGFPTDIPPPDKPAPADDTDREQLADMGIQPGEQPLMKSEKKHYACAFLSDTDFLQIIYALMSSPMPEADKTRLLGQLFTQDFPSLHGHA